MNQRACLLCFLFLVGVPVTSPALLNDHYLSKNFADWLNSHKVRFHDDVMPVIYEEFAFGIHSNKAVARESTLVEVPMQASIGPHTLERSPITLLRPVWKSMYTCNTGTECETNQIANLALFLLAEKFAEHKGYKSTHLSYVDSIQFLKCQNGLHFTARHMRVLQGSVAANIVNTYNTSFNKIYDNWFGFDDPFGGPPTETETSKILLAYFGRRIFWTEFAGALCAVMTRVFGMPRDQLPDPKPSSQHPFFLPWIEGINDGNLNLVLFLLPGGDLFNHKQFEKNVPISSFKFDILRDAFVLHNKMQWKADQQVYIDYGLKTNSHLLMQYGFILTPSNPQDSVKFPFRPLEGDPNQNWKRGLLSAMQLSNIKLYHDGIDLDSEILMRVVFTGPEEASAWHIQNLLRGNFKPTQDEQLMQNVMGQTLRKLCLARIRAQGTSMQEDMQLLRQLEKRQKATGKFDYFLISAVTVRLQEKILLAKCIETYSERRYTVPEP